MIVLQRRRLILCVCFVFASYLIYLNQTIYKTEKTIQTMTWLVHTKTIVLDAGHGLPDKRSRTGRMVYMKVILI